MNREIADVIEILECAEREGAPTDTPEGSRIVRFSETLIQVMLAKLRHAGAKTT